MSTDITAPQAQEGPGADKLAECLRGEISAVETYELALKHIDHVDIHRALQEILVSHSRRVDLLRDQMTRTGAAIPAGSGAWGAFAKAVQAGADLLSTQAAVAALEAGEDRGLAQYTSGLDDCDAETRSFISTSLLPEQQRTHELCRTLKNYLKQPS
jgi:demethoxyubiquinone hydroxylase (CLK1/Coq7/Cat5 family)